MTRAAYFIVNGTERVLMTLEDLASNKIMTEFTERYNERIYVAKVFSQFRGYRALVVVERNKKNLLEVSFPSVAGHLKFVDLMRALGMTNDQEVVNAVSTDEDILTFMMQNLEESECDSVEGGVMYVGKKLAPNQTKDYQRNAPSSYSTTTCSRISTMRCRRPSRKATRATQEAVALCPARKGPLPRPHGRGLFRSCPEQAQDR